MKNFLKRKIVLIILLLIVITLIISIVIIKNNNFKRIDKCEFNDENYSLNYDSTWNITEKNENNVELIHNKSGSYVKALIVELSDEIKYKKLDEIFDSFLYNIKEQNKDFNLLNKEIVNDFKNNLDAYKILMENTNNQEIVYIYKQGNRCVILSYEAENEYFDILLDSANSIINSFELKEKKYDIITDINLQTQKIDYTSSDEVNSLLKDTKDETISDLGFSVTYRIPSNFIYTDFKNYNFQNLKSGEYINLRANIFNVNIYEYFDKENSFNIYDKYLLNTYNESKVQIDKLADEPLSYIYKNSYLNNNNITENIELVFELDVNHIFSIQLNSFGTGIPEELVKMIGF